MLSTPKEWGTNALRYAPYVTGILVTGFVFWYAFQGAVVPRRMQANLVLGGSVLIYYYYRGYELLSAEGVLGSRDRFRLGWYVLAGTAGFLAAAYVHLNYYRWLENSALLIYNSVDLLVGATIMLLMIDMLFRSFGKFLGFSVVITLLYGLFGNYLPGFLAHRGLSISRLIARETIVLGGVYGTLLQIATTWVAIFIVFAGFVEAHGGFEFIRRLGQRVAALSRSGIAQSAVVSSMFIGMLTGGASVNVALTGSFTIPLMKDYNIPPRVAGGIESVASTGGQILPPVMGLAAFLIADFIGVRYADVVVAAVIPALFFYGTAAIGVHILIVSRGWSPDESPTELLANKKREGLAFLLEGLQYLIPIGVLLYLLLVLEYPIMLSGAYTIGAFLFLRVLFEATPYGDNERSLGGVVTFGRDTVNGMWLGGKRLAPFVGLLGALGMLVDVFAMSGLGLRLSTQIIIMSGGTIIAILLIAAFVSILFGLGMPTPAAYILVATVLAPALVRIGIASMTAHLFVFYFAMLSSITPPVATGVAVASEIAEADFVETAKSALALGGPVFVIPFAFVAHPSIINWSYPGVLYNTALIALGMLGLVFALLGSNGWRDYSYPERAVLFALFPIAIFPQTLVFRIPAAIGIVLLGLRGPLGLPTGLLASTFRR